MVPIDDKTWGGGLITTFKSKVSPTVVRSSKELDEHITHFLSLILYNSTYLLLTSFPIYL